MASSSHDESQTGLLSWVPGAEPSRGWGLRNLPFGVAELPSGAVVCVSRVGDSVVDLSALAAAGALPAPRGADDHAGGGRAGGGPPRGSGAPSVESDAPSDSEGEDDEGDDDGGAALEAAVDAAWHGAELAAAAAAGSALGAGADGARGDGVSTLSTAT